MGTTGLFYLVLQGVGSLVTAQHLGHHSLSINAMLAQNKYGVPSLIVPLPCQAKIYSTGHAVNYICMSDGKIMCLPGWKVITAADKSLLEILVLVRHVHFFQNPTNYCKEPICPDLCTEDRGFCEQPNE